MQRKAEVAGATFWIEGRTCAKALRWETADANAEKPNVPRVQSMKRSRAQDCSGRNLSAVRRIKRFPIAHHLVYTCTSKF